MRGEYALPTGVGVVTLATRLYFSFKQSVLNQKARDEYRVQIEPRFLLFSFPAFSSGSLLGHLIIPRFHLSHLMILPQVLWSCTL